LPQDYAKKKLRATGPLVWGVYAKSRPDLKINANFHEFMKSNEACVPAVWEGYAEFFLNDYENKLANRDRIGFGTAEQLLNATMAAAADWAELRGYARTSHLSPLGAPTGSRCVDVASGSHPHSALHP
jgi:hypothetical protein